MNKISIIRSRSLDSQPNLNKEEIKQNYDENKLESERIQEEVKDNFDANNLKSRFFTRTRMKSNYYGGKPDHFSVNPFKLLKKTTCINMNNIQSIASHLKNIKESDNEPMSHFSKISQWNYTSSKKISEKESAIPNIMFNECGWASILVVDDQIINRMILTQFGFQFKIRSDEAENGKIAFNMYKRQTEKDWWNGYRLILMDLNMPVMNGIRASQKIIEYNTTKPKPRIIAITAFNSELEEEKWYSVGISDFKLKPISLDTIIIIIELINFDIVLTRKFWRTWTLQINFNWIYNFSILLKLSYIKN